MAAKYDDSFPQVCNLLNLWQGFVSASKGRRSHPSVAKFEYNLETELVVCAMNWKAERINRADMAVSSCMNPSGAKSAPRHFATGLSITR